MHSKKLAFIYALLVWAIPFVAAMFLFDLRNNDRAFFESIMAVVAAATAVIFSALYFKKTESAFFKEGVWLGIIFLAVSIAVDLLMFSRGPMAMPVDDYLRDIAFTYLMYPFITVGMGYILKKKIYKNSVF